MVLPDFAYIDGGIRLTMSYSTAGIWTKCFPLEGLSGLMIVVGPRSKEFIKFVLTHRKYKEIDVGLPMEFVKLSRKRELLRLITSEKRVAGTGGPRTATLKNSKIGSQIGLSLLLFRKKRATAEAIQATAQMARPSWEITSSLARMLRGSTGSVRGPRRGFV